MFQKLLRTKKSTTESHAISQYFQVSEDELISPKSSSPEPLTKDFSQQFDTESNTNFIFDPLDASSSTMIDQNGYQQEDETFITETSTERRRYQSIANRSYYKLH